MSGTTEPEAATGQQVPHERVVMCDLRKKFTENAEQFDALMVEMLQENETLRTKYNELIMAVERKCPGESRHETALRYIKRSEELSTCNAAQST